MSEKEQKAENLFQKIGSNLKKELNHRTKSNVIASYIITWVILSWKSILYLIFSSDSLNTKLLSNYTQPTWSTFLLPLIGVGIYLLLVPILESTINVSSNWLTKPINDKIREQKNDMRIADIEDEIEVEVERNKIFEEMSNESELEKLTKSNLFLEKKIEELTVLIDSKDITITNLSNEIKELNKLAIKPGFNNQQEQHMRLVIKYPDTLDKFKSSFFEKDFTFKNDISIRDAEILTDEKVIILAEESEKYYLTEKGKYLRDYLKGRQR
jgi:hypothetical protein